MKRARVWPHVPGQYATFIAYPVSRLPQQVPLTHDMVVEEFTAVDQLHLSVSRTFPLKRSQLSRFSALLSRCFEQKNDDTIKNVIHVDFDRISLMLNDSKTTTFLVLVVDENCEGYDDLLDVIDTIDDQVMDKMKLEPFYDPPKPHISLAWAVGDFVSGVAQDKIDVPLESPIRISLDVLELLMGQHLHEFRLCNKRNSQ